VGRYLKTRDSAIFNSSILLEAGPRSIQPIPVGHSLHVAQGNVVSEFFIPMLIDYIEMGRSLSIKPILRNEDP